MRVREILALLVLCFLAVPLLQGQSATDHEAKTDKQVKTDDEIKFASQEYIPQEANAIRVKSTMVPVPVVVRDSHGDVVKGLKKEDFEIYDEGKKQNITLFNIEYARPTVTPTTPASGNMAEKAPTISAPVAPPRYIGMYFDDENMGVPDMVYARKAAEAFVRNTMEDTDRAAVFTASTTVTQQFTSDKQQLLDALGKLLSHQRKVSIVTCPNIEPYQAFQIGEFWGQHSDAKSLAVAEAMICHRCMDAQDCSQLVDHLAEQVVSLSEQIAQDSLGTLGDVVHYMGKMPGRRTLVMPSSGFFSLSETVQQAQDKIINKALQEGVVINTLDARGLTAPNDPRQLAENIPNFPGPLGAYQEFKSSEEQEVADDSLAALAEGTGGKFIHNTNDLDKSFRKLAELPEVTYVLGFSPEEEKLNGAKHSLKVKIPSQQHITITARPAYMTSTKQEAAPSTKFQRLNTEVMASDTVSEMPAQVDTQSGNSVTGETAVKVIAHLNGRGLNFKKMEDGRQAERIIFVTALFDLHGRYLAGTEGVMELKLKNDMHAQIARAGVSAKATLQAPPGTYRLREVVQEVVGGRIAASTKEVEIR
jgi:VWFA-related protein